MLANREKTLADQRLSACVGKRDSPVREVLAEKLDIPSTLRQNKVVGKRSTMIQKESLDCLALMAQAQNEVLVAIVGVVLHQVPDDGRTARGAGR